MAGSAVAAAIPGAIGDSAAAGTVAAARPVAQLRQLTWALAWAVVFCDIGTSVYYVPGIVYETVGNLAPLFVTLTTAGFILLSLKYTPTLQTALGQNRSSLVK